MWASSLLVHYYASCLLFTHHHPAYPCLPGYHCSNMLFVVMRVCIPFATLRFFCSTWHMFANIQIENRENPCPPCWVECPLCLCLLSTHADCFNPYLNFHLLNFYSPYQELRINVRQKNNRKKNINIYSTQSKQAEYCDLQERAKNDQLLSLLLELFTLTSACLLHTRANSVKPPPFPFIPLQRSEITSISHTAKGTPEIFLVSARHLSQRKRTPKHKTETK